MRTGTGWIRLLAAMGVLAVLAGRVLADDGSRPATDGPAIDIRLIEPGSSVKPPAADKPAPPPAEKAASSAPAPAAQPATPPVVKSAPAKASAPPAQEAFKHRSPIDGLNAGLLGPTMPKAAATVRPSDLPAPETNGPRVIAPQKLADKAAEKSAAEKSATEKPAAKPDGNALKPIPEEEQGPIDVEVASFKGITPGKTTVAELEKAWGEPKQVRAQGKDDLYLFAVEPFRHVEVTCHEGKVAAISIGFEKSFPAAGVAKQLGLARIRPVLVANELGEILGQAYPERGVLLAFEPAPEPGKPSLKVSQIIIEPLSADTFVLRAETVLDTQPVSSLDDLENAVKLQPKAARAQWLKSRILTDMADFEKALAAADLALRVEPENAQYRVTRAQILGQSGRLDEAIEEAQRAVDGASRRPHVKARALCLLGDLAASEPMNDYKRAIEYHMQAIGEADALAGDRYPAIRMAAKEVLVDAHLGAAHDIAWGNWKEKEKAINRWLDRAKVLIDELIKNDGASDVYRLRLSARALSACVGARGVVAPGPWTEEALKTGQSLIAGAQDPLRKAQFQWDVGMALYDSLQVYQIRGEHDTAMKYGEMAIEYLEKGQPKNAPAAGYLLGRLYFRMGAVYALRDQNHRAATSWFEKAVPLLERPLPPEAGADLGRHGETFVSMGVSFWETGQRERAVEVSERGVKLMEQAVKQGLLNESALMVGYGNLATMHRALGKRESAARFDQQAARLKAAPK